MPTIKEVSPNVLLVSFPNRKELTFTMCRVEEFYEAASDKLRGQVFTWAEFIDEFTDDEGHMDYFHSWSGFNVPGATFNTWMTNFKDMSSRELELIRLVMNGVSNITDLDSRYYIIAAVTGGSEIEDHEIAHATYYVNEDYKIAMDELNAKLDADARLLLINSFTDLGYSATVHEDELQAFLGTSTSQYLNNRFGMSTEMFDKVTPAYMDVFTKFCKTT